MTTTDTPHAVAELDFTFDVDPIAALVEQLSDTDRKALYQRLGVRPAPKPRTPKPAAEPYVPNTGDSRLDAFLAEHHDPAWKPKMPRPSSRAKGPSPSTVGAFEDAAAQRWRERGYTVERTANGWEIRGTGDGSFQRQTSAAYVQTSSGWKHPDDVAEGAR